MTILETATFVGRGPYYKLSQNPSGQLIIRRQDWDHARTVALIDSRDQWKRFVRALETGANEVAAVHAIDS